MRKMMVLVAAVLATTLLTAGCSPSGPLIQPDSVVRSTFPLTVTDGNGRDIVIDDPPGRIIAIDSAAVEILFSIGEGDRIVGVHDFVSFPPEVNGIEKIGGAFSLNFERIVTLRPDLVVVFFDSSLPDFDRLDLKTIYLPSPVSLDDISERIRTWGRIVGQSEKGDRLALNFDRSLEQIHQSVERTEIGPSIYHDEAPGWWTAGSKSLANDIYEFLNLRNVFADIEGFAQVSVEQIIARDPEAIVSVHPDGLEILKSEPGLQGISAIVNDQIIDLDGDLLSIPGPRVLDGVRALAKFLYE